MSDYSVAFSANLFGGNDCGKTFDSIGRASCEVVDATFFTGRFHSSERDLEFSKLMSRLGVFLRLSLNWNSYKSVRVNAQAVYGAAFLIRSLKERNGFPLPQVVPTASGGVQLEWHQNGVDLEIEFDSISKADVYYEDEFRGESKEFEMSCDFSPIWPYLEKLM